MANTWTDAMPGMVPASVPASVQSGPDINELLKNIVTPIDPNLIRAATSPVPGSHAAQIPSSLMRPIAPNQPGQLDHREVVGAGNARAQGIGNSVIAVGNLIGTLATKEKQQKQDQLRDAAQKAITAQQGIDEAKQALAAANAEPEGTPGRDQRRDTAQRMIEQNTNARNAIFADPKIRKGLQKGFDISYTDPQSNKTDEHAAVQEAIKGAKTFAEKRAAIKQLQAKQNQQAGTEFGTAFEQSQPQGLAPNVQAQQQLQAQLAQQKIQAELASKLLTVQGANARAAFVQASQNLRQMQNQSFMAQKIDQVFSQNKYLDSLRHTYRLGEIGARVAATSAAALNLFRQEHLDPTVLEEFQTKTTQNFIRDEGILATALQKAQGDYSNANAVFGDPKTTKAQRDQATQILNDAKASIYSLQAQQRNLQSYKDNFYEMVSNLKNVGSGSGNVGAD